MTGIVAILVQATGAPAFSAACSGASAGVPVDGEKAPPGDIAGRIRDEPDKRRRHNLQAGSACPGRSPAASEIIGVFVTPPGTRTLTVTPVPPSLSP